jgi:hypothetical protein
MAATELTPKQRLAVAALMEHGEVLKASEAANVSRTTLYKWLADPTFMAALREAEADALKAVSRSLVALSGRATRTIDAAMNESETMTTRLKAADTVLARLLQLRELIDLDGRVGTLEKRMEQRK